ncbi:VirK family protein [Rhizobium sp. 768_B6_N1_8]|uniref:VirK family protein n=1 Tax=unclassified Rhizobium TaxID=2613769 RepID=UPI003F1FE7EA
MLRRLIGSSVALLVIFGQASAQEPTKASEFDDILGALSQAKQVTLIVDFSSCKDPQDSPATRIQAGLRIQSFMVVDGDQIAFSDAHTALDKDGNPFTDYVRYRVKREGVVEIRHDMVHAGGAAIKPAETYRCAIGNAAHFVW